MTKHSFDSQTVVQKNTLESTVVNKRSFFSSVVNKHTFESIVDGFVLSTSWAIKFISNTGINATISVLGSKSRIFTEFSTNAGMAIDRLLVTMKIKPKIEVISNTAISAIMKMNQKMGVVTFESINTFQARMRDLLKINSTNASVTVTNIEVNLVAQKYYLLSDWDVYLLSDLDAMLLSAMDYQVV